MLLRECQANVPVLIEAERSLASIPVIFNASKIIEDFYTIDSFNDTLRPNYYKMTKGGELPFDSIGLFTNVAASTTDWHYDGSARSGWLLLLKGRKIWSFKSHERKDRDKIITLVQHPNELVFVAGGWWHKVESDAESIGVGGWCIEDDEILLQRLTNLKSYHYNNTTVTNELKELLVANGQMSGGKRSKAQEARKLRTILFGARKRKSLYKRKRKSSESKA